MKKLPVTCLLGLFVLSGFSQTFPLKFDVRDCFGIQSLEGGGSTNKAVGVKAMVAADFNNDGNVDFLFGPGRIDVSSTVECLGVAYGTGDGSILPAAMFSAYPNPTLNRELAAGDFNNDGRKDILLANTTFPNNAVNLYINKSSGGFSLAPPTKASVDTSWHTAYLNGDHLLDYVGQGGGVGERFNVHTNVGNNTFSNSVYTVPGTLLNIMPGPYLTSNRVDLLVGTSSAVILYTNDGNATFSPVSTNAVSISPWYMGFGDFNHDNIPDLAIASNGGNKVGILFGDGVGGFGNETDVVLPSVSKGLDVADFNGDGNLDVVTWCNSTNAGAVSILLGNGAGGALAVTNFSVSNLSCVVVADLNHDLKPDLVIGIFDEPKLQVWLNRTPVGSPAPQLALGINPVLTLSGSAGSTYRVDYTTDLQSNVWTPLTNLVLPGSSATVIDPAPASVAFKSYRAVLVP